MNASPAPGPVPAPGPIAQAGGAGPPGPPPGDAPGGPPGQDGGGAQPSPAPGPAGEQESFSLGAGGNAGAAFQFGEGSRRAEYLRAAGRWFGGDYVGGDKEHIRGDKNVFNFGGRPEPRPVPLPPRLTALIEAAFVPPDCLSRVQAAVTKRRTVILCGPGGYGKAGLAIHLLLETCTGDLFGAGDLADPAALREWIGDPQENHELSLGGGFVLLQPGPRYLHGSALQGLEEVLERTDGRLILIVADDAAIPADLRDYVVEVTSAPDRTEVFGQHLRHHTSPEAAERLLAVAELRDIVRPALGGRSPCRHAADLAAVTAELDAEAGESGDIDLDRLRAAVARCRGDDFDVWFSGLGSTAARCFAVALAFLNGFGYDTVARAARALNRRFGTGGYTLMVQAHEPLPDVQRPFMLTRREWLSRLQATARRGEVTGPYGVSVTDVAEYEQDDYPRQVILRVWSDYQAQDVLLDWLGKLAAEDTSERVRIVASQALGLLASWSFDHLCDRVLGPWATGTLYQRNAAAYALMTATDAVPALSGNVEQLVTGWFRNLDEPLAQATAARVYGLARQVVSREEALSCLERLTAVDDVRVVIAVGDALADLLAGSPDGLGCLVLTSLASRLSDPKRSVAVQLVFLILASTLTTDVPAGRQVAPWPYLLDLATREPLARATLVRLWKHVINGSHFTDETAQVMSDWARATEQGPAAQEAFLRLVRGIATGDRRSQQILARYAAKWDSDDNFSPLPGASAAVRAILEAERTP
jgi:hypothetical protein